MIDKWDTFFLQNARLVAKLSKDPSTQVGAVITDERRILATGYNGFPRGIPDLGEWYFNRERKLLFTEHAEINAILAAGRAGVSVEGCTIYSTHFSCNECCKHTIQAGIKRFVYIEDLEFQTRWDATPVLEMFQHAGIDICAVKKNEFNLAYREYGFQLEGYEP